MTAFFQWWTNFSQNYPLIVPYIYLLGGKALIFGAFALLAAAGSKMVKDPGAPVFDANWNMRSVAEVFFIFIAFQAVAVYFKTPFMDSPDLEGIVAVWAIVEYLFLFVLLWFILRFVLGKDLAHVGWHSGGLAEDAVVAFRGILFLGVLAGLTNFLYWTEILTPSTKIIERVTLASLFSKGIFSVLQMVLVLIVSPVCEETFYRGFIYPVLRNKLPRFLAVGLVSLFFAAVHFQWNYFILLFLMSCAVTVAYDKTKRLVAPVAIHAVYNILIMLGVFSY